MMYLEAEINIDYNRSLFLPEDDEIVIMQQHCGGENITVFKGLLKPDGNSYRIKLHLMLEQNTFFLRTFCIYITKTYRLSICLSLLYKWCYQ